MTENTGAGEYEKQTISRYQRAIEMVIERRCADSDRRVEALEARVVAAEETSKAATAQMTAVLAVLNVLSHLAPPKLGQKWEGNT